MSDLAPTHTITAATPYYAVGPQQARPPDGTLAAGTRVVLLAAAIVYRSGFIRVRLAIATQVSPLEAARAYFYIATTCGVTGWVASQALAPLDLTA